MERKLLEHAKISNWVQFLNENAIILTCLSLQWFDFWAADKISNIEVNSLVSDARAFVFIEGLFWGMVGAFNQRSIRSISK